MSRCLLRTAAALSIFGFAAVPAQAQVNVLTQHNDIARTGQNLSETSLTTRNVNVARFGKLFERPVDSNIWSQPLYVSGVSIPGKGTRNVVYVETEVGQVYAFDADNANETSPLWRRDLASNDFADSLSTPVIDLARKTIYLVVRRVDRKGTSSTTDDVYSFTFHALDITTGLDKFPQVAIQGNVAGTGKSSVNGRLSFRADTQKQRPALLELKNIIYVAFGGGIYEYEESAVWNGWIFGMDAATGAIKSIFAVSPNRNGGGIWQAANGLASNGTNIFTVTANGGNNPLSTSTQSGGHDYGNSAIKLTPNATGTALTVSDFWTPWDFQYMEDADQDLGSAGPLLIPGTNLLMTGDKTGRLYVINTTNMGKYTAGKNSIVQDILGWKGHLHGGPVYWNSPNLGPLVYGWAEHDYMRAFKVLGNQGLQVNPAMKSLIQVPPGMPGGMLSISAKGSTAGTGIVWVNAPYIGDANKGIVPGVLRAFDATDITKELWNSEIYSSRDTVGYYAKFTPPTVANGKVYLASFYNPANFLGAKLLVYGLLPSTTVPAAPTSLTAAGMMNKVRLTWKAPSGATTYSVKRGTKTGTYTVIATNLRSLTYDDTTTTNGTKYFYVVTASNSGGEGPNSNEANATPFAPAAGSIIGIDFVGGGPNGTPQTMAATEKAGVIPATDWNSVTGASGTANNLRSVGGSQTSASAVWSCGGTFSSTFSETAGNYRMMKGYLSNAEGGGATVTVSSLPSNITASGYDVYVYIDGNNPTATRAGNYTLGSTTQHLTDAQNRDFDGVFVSKGIADVGNYLLFENVTGSSFKLTAAAADSTDTTHRCPINGLQIVARQNTPPVKPAGPTNLVATPGNNQVALGWTGVTGASSYKVYRSQVQAGPYNNIKAGVTETAYGDATAKNNVTYYYYVTAVNASGESARSNIVAATPSASYIGRVISLDFGGGSTPAVNPGTGIGAGGVVRPRWNSVFFASGGKGDVMDDTGAATTADVTWSFDQVGDTSITADTEKKKMMRGYVTPNTNPGTVNVFNLPAAFTSKGYDVYVYFDNNNNGTRIGRYTIGTQTVTGTDAAGVNFAGNFAQANNSAGNFVKLMGFKTASFTLTCTPVSSTDGTNGAPVNGLQIVARNAPPQAASILPSQRTSQANSEAETIATTYGDPDGNEDLSIARILVNTQADGVNGLIGHYDALKNLLYLVDAQGALKGGFAPGSDNIIQTGRGILDCKNTTVTRNNNTLKISWVLTAKTPMIGTKNIYLRAVDVVGAAKAWTKVGTWTITSGPSSSISSETPSAKAF